MKSDAFKQNSGSRECLSALQSPALLFDTGTCKIPSQVPDFYTFLHQKMFYDLGVTIQRRNIPTTANQAKSNLVKANQTKSNQNSFLFFRVFRVFRGLVVSFVLAAPELLSEGGFQMAQTENNNFFQGSYATWRNLAQHSPISSHLLKAAAATGLLNGDQSG